MLDHFLPFYPPNNMKNQNFEKLKTSEDNYHFMHVYHKWQSYDVWILIECDKQILLSFFTIFWKICLEIFSFYTSLPKIMIMLYCSWDMVHDGCNSYFSFFFYFLPFYTLTAWNMKISKKRKKCLEMSLFYISVPKIIIIWYTVPEI